MIGVIHVDLSFSSVGYPYFFHLSIFSCFGFDFLKLLVVV